jgi:hypothetical protein
MPYGIYPVGLLLGWYKSQLRYSIDTHIVLQYVILCYSMLYCDMMFPFLMCSGRGWWWAVEYPKDGDGWWSILRIAMGGGVS